MTTENKIDRAILLQLQNEARATVLEEIEYLQGKLLAAKRRLDEGRTASAEHFAGNAGDLDRAIATHATLTKLIEMGE